MKFSELELKESLVDSMKKLKLEETTEVQEKAIPLCLSGKDVIVRSKTGSGKTFAFLLPILHKLTDERYLQAMILVPTRELVGQIEKEIRKIGFGDTTVTIYGGVAYGPQEEKLANGARIAIATPGRLLDLIQKRTINTSKVHFAVLDEADRMLDMGFIDDVKRILSAVPKQRQTMLFSATMPEQIVDLAKHGMHAPETLLLQKDEITVDKIRQKCIGLDRKQKMDELIKILNKKETQKVIVFCNTKDWAERLSNILYRKRFKTSSLHSKLSQNKRNRVIQNFNKGYFDILVATDVASRGLHINDVTHVINYDIPRNPKDYVHRIGRTGRAGQEGDAITFVTAQDQQFLRGVEDEIQMSFNVEVNGKPMQALEAPQASQQGGRHGDDWGLD